MSLDEVTEENVRLNLLQERLEEDDGRQGSTKAGRSRQIKKFIDQWEFGHGKKDQEPQWVSKRCVDPSW